LQNLGISIVLLAGFKEEESVYLQDSEIREAGAVYLPRYKNIIHAHKISKKEHPDTSVEN
jgi:hypothetical protein